MKKESKLLTPVQLRLPYVVEKEAEIDGIGMGVLTDGTAYLTGRGLARMCGVDQKVIVQMTAQWEEDRPREARIKDALRQQGVAMDQPYIVIQRNGATHHAFPDIVCMAVLEYYAFEAAEPRPQALKNYRLLARRSFRDFIYTQVGYDPRGLIPVAWQQFHDRVSLVYDSVPAGYFGIFKEIADIIVTLIRGGALVGPEFVPDISVGVHWGKHWVENGFDAVYGNRIKYEHAYPNAFPQAASNPQAVYCYPDAALGEFRRWMRVEYLPGKFPGYLSTKERQGALPPSFKEIAVEALIERQDVRKLPRRG